MSINTLDLDIIKICKKIGIPLARIGIFVIFFWFGLLKVIGMSPAEPLVQNLFEHTIPFISFGAFIVLFGLFECLIGILFIIKGLERIVIPLLFIHMITTILPLFVLSDATWASVLVPTLTGQYIIKNVAIIACAIIIASSLTPIKQNGATL
jgi:uncharacterized membrane protein YkgB